MMSVILSRISILKMHKKCAFEYDYEYDYVRDVQMMTRNIDGNYDVLVLLPKMNQMHNDMIKQLCIFKTLIKLLRQNSNISLQSTH